MDQLGTATGLRARRHWASLLTLGFALSQIVAFLHLAVVHHAPCFEHGGTVHVEEGGHEHSLADQADPTTRLAAGDVADHAHDDCTYGARDREADGPPARLALSAPALRPLVHVVPAPRPVHFAQAPLWLVAPKQGPPALG